MYFALKRTHPVVRTENLRVTILCCKVILTLLLLHTILLPANVFSKETSSSPKDERHVVVNDFERLKRLANDGSAEAQYNLGVAYSTGNGQSINLTDAFEWFLSAAKQGYANAQYMVGSYYYEGTGMEKDLELAAKWIGMAASQEFPDAQCMLGSMYMKGEGVEKDVKKGKQLFQIALKNNSPLALYYGADLLRKSDPVGAYNLFQEAASLGSVKAKYALGRMYTLGSGVEQDYKMGVHWYISAAESGYAPAMVQLGVMSLKGWGTEKDLNSACKLFLKAAQLGDVDAQFMVGSALHEGIGCDRDIIKAEKWLKKSAAQGNERAIAVLRYLESTSTAGQERVIIPFPLKSTVDISIPYGSKGKPMDGPLDGSMRFEQPLHPVGSISNLKYEDNEIELVSSVLTDGILETVKYGGIEVILFGTGPRGGGFKFLATPKQIEKMKKALE